jgi:outer membrane protein TolC
MLAALLVVALAAPPPLRLSDLLREAQDKNPEFKAAQARASAAVSSVSPAGALDDPMLMVQVWNAPLDLSSVPVMLQITQPLPLGGKRAARRDSANADAEAARASAAATSLDVRTAVVTAYFGLFLAQRTQEIDDDVEGVLNLALRAAEARVGAGKAEQVDLLKAQAAALQLRSEREVARDQEASAWAKLAALLDRDPASSPGTTTRPAPLPSLPGVNQLRERALHERPELATARAMISGAEAQVRLAHAATVPDIALSAAAMHTFHAPAGPDNFFFAGVQVNLPIFSGSKNQPRVSAAAQQVDAARNADRAMRNKVASEIAEEYAHVQSEARQIALHDQLIPIATQTVESAEASYAAGRADFLMVLDSVRELRMHHLNRAIHLAQYEQRLAALERAVGADLGLVAAAEAGHAHDH